MITNYYTLQALIEEWQEPIVGTTLLDAFSQQPQELSLAFASEERESMVRIATRAPLRLMFRVDGYSKARRNVATLFADAFGRRVDELKIAERDRVIFIRLEGGIFLQILLFGPRPNVLLVSPDGRISAAFQNEAELVGEEPPPPRPAPRADDLEAFRNRWRTKRKTVAHALSSACPLFDRTISTEAAGRAGVDPEASPEQPEDALGYLFEAAMEVEGELENPAPRIYWKGEDPEVFSLLKLTHTDLHEETFDTVDSAAKIYARRSLARRHFRELFDPVEKALSDAAEHYRTSAERMLDELSEESRAHLYERWGHLLMATLDKVPPGAEEVELADLFSEGEMIVIPLDPARSAVENAQRYYDRARRTLRSREEAEHRLVETEEKAAAAESLLEEVQRITDLRSIEAFRKEKEDDLAQFMSDEDAPGDRVPFRRFKLPGGYEVWVGRNARQNDDLTFHHAQKYDLWMHARGVPGSHAVLRKPNRDAEPDRNIILRAAAVAAYFSKARGSGLVPVMVTERKYVRKPKGSPPGAVGVEREEVILVEPALPR